MAKLSIAPTKSNLLSLRRQLAFAEEGFDLLEQKRQVLILELISRLNRARKIEQTCTEALGRAFVALQESLLGSGSRAIHRVLPGVRLAHEVNVADQRLMGIKVPRVTSQIEPPDVQFGFSESSSNTDVAMRCFTESLPLVAELAELQNAVLRLARELRKTQRRCNALSKIFIPDYRETISWILGTLEERERESFIILKMIRNHLAQKTLH